MPELNFQVTGVESAARSLVPLLHFKFKVSSTNPTDAIQGLLLNAQIQIQSPQRNYSPPEKERLLDLFGTPDRWGQTLRNRLWTYANCTLGAFTGTTETILPVPCTFDLNVAAVKYLYALEQGEVPLLFLFSGSVFYLSAEGKLQVERISWEKECTYRMPIELWKRLMDEHYPNCGWMYLKRDVFDRLYAYRRAHGFTNWDQAVESLLVTQEDKSEVPSPSLQGEELPA
jgi:hypothetical protein